MFDGFKIFIRDQTVVSQLFKNRLLEFIEHANTNTGEILNHTAEYRGIKIKTYPSGLIEIKGSFHKYFNDGSHNHDDFTIENMNQVINSFENNLEINPYTASIHNLEFGVNIHTVFRPDDLINALHCYKWKPFNVMDVKFNGNGRECKRFKQYYVKVYNKGLQYDQPENILRVEKKVVSMCALKYGKLNLSDLTNPALWKHCKHELIEMFKNILINESIDISLLTRNEQRIYNTVVNQSKWAEFSQDQKKRYKKAFNRIISNYGKVKYQPAILKLINDKCDELMEIKVHTF